MAADALVPAELRARLKLLRLGGRRIHGGDGFGQHRSRSRGAGLEFAQYRAYEPGDELRQIDWKLYARSDRFFVREAERDSPLTAWVVVDTSASMRQANTAGDPRTRLDVARTLAAAVFELALAQGDRFGLAAVGGAGLQLVPAGTGPRHRDRCLHLLLALQADGVWPAEPALRPLWERTAPGHLVLLLGDDFDDAAVPLMEKLSAARRDVATVQLLTVDERDFAFRGGHRFRDPETGAELVGDGASVRDDFLARFAAARRALDARLAAAGVRRVEHVLDEPAWRPRPRRGGGRAGGGGTGRGWWRGAGGGARRERTPLVEFAALRWLAARQRPRQRLRFDEVVLLLVRLALIAAIALLLARPAWTGGAATAVLAVHPALAGTVNAAEAASADGHSRVWLAPGFPALDRAAPAAPVATASLLRELDASLPAASALRVRVPAWFDGADGERPRLSRPVQWEAVAVPDPAAATVPPRRAPALAIRHDAADASGVRYLRAAARAWAVADAATPTASADGAAAAGDPGTPSPDDAVDIASVDADPDAAGWRAAHPDGVLAWLATEPPPAAVTAWIDAGGTLLATAPADACDAPRSACAVIWRDDTGAVTASAVAAGRGRIVRLHRPLRPDGFPALLEPDFPGRLRGLLQPSTPPPTRADAQALAPLVGGPAFAVPPRPLVAPLLWAIVALFALERWLASGRRVPEPA